MDIYDLANNPALARLVSHEGTINMRLPGVAYVGSRPPPEPGPIGRGAGGRESPPGANTLVAAPPVAAPPGAKTPSPPKTSNKKSDVPLPTGGVPRRTKLGEKGDDVVAWQKFLLAQGFDLKSYGADGDHGQTTEKASLEWERKPGKVNTASVASLVGSPGGMPNTGLAIVVAAVGAGVGWLAWHMMMEQKK
jgi:hypothetical protein